MNGPVRLVVAPEMESTAIRIDSSKSETLSTMTTCGGLSGGYVKIGSYHYYNTTPHNIINENIKFPIELFLYRRLFTEDSQVS